MDWEHQTKNNRRTAAEDGTPAAAIAGSPSATLQYQYCTSPSTATLQTCNYNPSSTSFMSLRAGTTFSGFNISAFIDNLLDAHPTTEYNFQGTDPFQSPAPTALYRNFTFRPRTFGITFTYRQ
jgi:hypothetical protein